MLISKTSPHRPSQGSTRSYKPKRSIKGRADNVRGTGVRNRFRFEVLHRDITDEEFAMLRKLLDEDVPLGTIALIRNELDDNKFAKLPLEELSLKVDKLVVRSQNISDNSIELLLQAMRKAGNACTITSLDFSGNEELSARSGTALGTWVTQQPRRIFVSFHGGKELTLKRNLARQNIKGASVGYIAQLIASDTRITSLSLQGNKLGKDGFRMLARALYYNETIEQLDLQDCNAGLRAWQALYDALCRNHTVRRVDLRRNRKLYLAGACVTKLMQDAKRLWPAFSNLALLLDQGSWLDNEWHEKMRPKDTQRRSRRATPSVVETVIPLSHRVRVASVVYTTDGRKSPPSRRTSIKLHKRGNSAQRKSKITLTKYRMTRSTELQFAKKSETNLINITTFEGEDETLEPVNETKTPEATTDFYYDTQEDRNDHLSGEDDANEEAQPNNEEENCDSASLDDVLPATEAREQNQNGENEVVGVMEEDEEIENIDRYGRENVQLRVGDLEHEAALKIQLMFRCYQARKLRNGLMRVERIKQNYTFIRSAAILQKFYRRMCALRQAKLEECCIMVQKHFRRYMAQKRFAALGIALVRSASVKNFHTLRLTRLRVVECGLTSCCGAYVLMGSGTDVGTAKYVLEQPPKDVDYMIERQDRVWHLFRIQHATGSVETLYANRTISLFPPKEGWKTLQTFGPPLPAPVLSLKKTLEDGSEAPDDDDEELALLERQCRDSESIRVADAGSPEVNGLYIVVGSANGAPLYMKRESTGRYNYTIRRVSYLNNQNLWVVCRQVTDQRSSTTNLLKPSTVEDTKIFYVNKANTEQPPDTFSAHSWVQGINGKVPVPIMVWQNESARRLQQQGSTSPSTSNPELTSFKKRMQATTFDDEKHKAACIIQRAYRAHMLVHIASASYTLKELSSIVAVKLSDCGMPQAKGIYKCSTISQTSKSTGSSTMTYVLESASSEEWFVIERIRDGTMWAVMRIQGQTGVPDIIYFNKANGHALIPPRLGWKASNTKYVASPRLDWFTQDQASELDYEDEDDEIIQVSQDGKTKSGKALGHSVSKRELRQAHRIKDKYKNAVVVADAGSLIVHGRFEEHGVADGVPAYRSNRDPNIHLRRVVHGSAQLWVIVRITPSSTEPNIVYYFNSLHGKETMPPTEDWAVHKGYAPPPLVVIQYGCSRRILTSAQ